MYTEFFGLHEKPFALVPDPRYLFLGRSHREALAHLLYGIEQGEGFIEVVGQVGTGKTTLCRTLVQRLGPEVDLAYIFNPSASETELLAAINREFGLPIAARTRAELLDDLNQHLLARKAVGRRSVLLIDEAQNLETDVLEQVRLISNLETEREKLIQIVLCGQPELEENLARAELRQLRQRITVRWHLLPLNEEEVGEYLEHRLRIAGSADPGLFSRDAVRVLYRASDGVPRLVNAIADRALLAAWSAGQRKVGAREVRRAARELPATEVGGWQASLGLRWGVAGALLALGVASGLVLVGWSPWRAPLPAVAAASAPRPRAAVARVAPAPAVQPAPVSVAEPTASPAATPPEPVGLEPRLRALDARKSAALALDRLLEIWGYDPIAGEEMDPNLFASAVREISPLNVFVTRVTREVLAAVDIPVIVELELAPAKLRYAALIGLDREGIARIGIGGETFEITGTALDRLLTGRCFIVWTNFERLPVLVPGMSGSAVRWLQARLTELGYLRRGEASGLFDERTASAIRRFQTERRLDSTGDVGPETLIALYQALRYGAPHLALADPDEDVS
jgi:general secretion pathway protein A